MNKNLSIGLMVAPIILFAFLILVVENHIDAFIIILLFVMFIAGTVLYVISRRKEKEIMVQEEERIEKQNAIMEKAKAQENAVDREKALFIQEHGEPDKTIVFNKQSFENRIMAYETQRVVYIYGKPYSFDDIISYSVEDNQTVIKGDVISKTTTSTGSAVGRAIVGGVIAGPVGAIIGGATGKKNTVTHQNDDIVKHRYTILINIKSLSNPTIRISAKESQWLVSAVSNLFTAIIAMKGQKL